MRGNGDKIHPVSPFLRFSDSPFLFPMSTTRLDISLLLIALALVATGTVMIYSASSVLGEMRFESSSFFLNRWLLRAGLALLLMTLVMRVNYQVWALLAKPLLILGVGLLLAVALQKLLSGNAGIRGAHRWIQVASVSFQPSELVKLILVIYLAESLARRQAHLHEIREFGHHAAVVAAVAGLIVLQPDLGMAVGLGAVAALMMVVAGVRLRYMFGSALAALPLLYVLIFWVGYRKDRIEAFLSRGEHIQGKGYQITQSLVGLASGGLTGVGLGQSHQKFLFLPDPHTDFVFSILGEEWGLLGTVTVVVLFLLFGLTGFRIARRAPDLHGFLLSVGVTSLVLVYALLNVGVVTAVLPTTGLPLPFISYGGSSLMLTLIGVGILLNVARQGVAPQTPLAPMTGALDWPPRPGRGT
ncbi:MAG: cell division protein FtsW [Candidatus Handelsmanbacteria bacterium RIFCSPLOWO2_12_FULL_64_10]|uniref:Probable peptidoglycan glycosyltransferase FtsW n=1 Tax=Handelsmanbacteria sp. (strain RIFCSPLOWO2_12_FULL_64_10) TaxID=1817868 RepID=A0A1F6CSR8_HANXR|nr:MAG: cell division protein FtsW [Candidatus Handelsmanbacteria bacterium RIFCSPLOWO2_12_FULL_64_10]